MTANTTRSDKTALPEVMKLSLDSTDRLTESVQTAFRTASPQSILIVCAGVSYLGVTPLGIGTRLFTPR